MESRSRRVRWVPAVALGVLVVLAVVVIVRRPDSGAAVTETTSTSTTVDVRPVPVPPAIASYVTPDAPTAVGVRTVTVVDPTRGTLARGEREALDERPLTVTVRYPTAGMPADDDIVDAPGLLPAPLVLFAHGYDISADRYSVLQHELASYGFVVAAPEFPMTSTVFDGAPDEYDLPEQARDLSFLIDALTGPSVPPELAQLIAPGPVGLRGHSDGAVTVLLCAFAPRFADPRVGAVVAVSGAFDKFGGSWFTTADPPLVAVHGEWDEINPFSSSESLVDNDPGPAMLVEVTGALHLGAVVEPANALAVARLAAFDFLWRLSGVPTARDATYLTADTSPLRLVSDHD
ncbi:MAG: alpha/beta hydrolase family protein [Acidimicrobiia bacterium]